MSGKSILYLGNQLSGHGFTPTSVETLGERLRENFRVVRASSIRFAPLRLLDMWYKILTNRGNLNYILIDTYSTRAFHYAWTSARLARFLNVPYIPILHGGDLPQRMDSNPRFSQKYLSHAYRVVCPSGYLKEEVEKRFSKVQVNIIPNFIDIENYPFKLKKIDNIRLLWVRSFHSIYEPELAIRVLKLLVEEGYEDASLCMVGPDKDGSLERTKKLARDLGVYDKVIFTGRLLKEEWIARSADYNIFINTTNFDNTPVSVMEAMALGFPVVSTNVGGMSYLISNGEDGILVPPKNVMAMANAIQRLCEEPNLIKNLSYATRRKAETWDWKNIKDHWALLLNKRL